jgi:hypothetical protein
MFSPKIKVHTRGLRVDDSVTYTSALDMQRTTVAFLAGLLEAERARRGTRTDTRALTCFHQAILVVRWFLDAARVTRLATDHRIGLSTAYRYLHEGIDALAAQAPDLHTALEHAKHASISHLSLDGVVIPTDRCTTPGPTKDVDLWWSGKHGKHGGNIQVLTLPDGWPLWTSPVRPGREHDITAARAHDLIEPLTHLALAGLPTLADLGYEGEPGAFVMPIKKPKGRKLTTDQETYNKLQRGTRGQGERAHALLIMRFKVLRRITLCPWTIGRVIAAAVVLLSHENDRLIPAAHAA